MCNVEILPDRHINESENENKAQSQGFKILTIVKEIVSQSIEKNREQSKLKAQGWQKREPKKPFGRRKDYRHSWYLQGVINMKTILATVVKWRIEDRKWRIERKGKAIGFDQLKNYFNSNAWANELYVKKFIGGVWDV